MNLWMIRGIKLDVMSQFLLCAENALIEFRVPHAFFSKRQKNIAER